MAHMLHFPLDVLKEQGAVSSSTKAHLTQWFGVLALQLANLKKPNQTNQPKKKKQATKTKHKKQANKQTKCLASSQS